VACAVTSGALAVNSLTARPSLIALYLVSALAAGLTGFANPARNAIIPSLVKPEHLIAALAFVQILMQLGTIVGPAVAGLLLGPLGAKGIYTIDAASFVAMTVTSARMASIPAGAGTRRPGLASIAEGFAFLRGRQAIQGAYAIDLNAMVFGMPRALFPALARNVFRGGPTTLGFLYAAPGAGALIGAITTGWVNRVRRQGRSVTLAVVVWGAAITAFGFAHLLWLALVLLAVAGWADVISAVLRNAIIQTSSPDEFRSRLSSIQMAVVQGGPRLGDMEAGAVATALGTQFSIVSGGLVCVVGAAVLATVLPGFRRHSVTAAEGEPHGAAPTGSPFPALPPDGLAPGEPLNPQV
jgi:MFS family permease